MRTLASIQRITDIQPIEGADAIDRASVLGWHVVVKKGDFQVGDLAVYLEIDSVPPDEEQYRFLWKWAETRPNNYRIRTVKLRGQISQGILFPLEKSTMDPKNMGWIGTKEVYEGDDVTELLRVTKYDPPLPGGGTNIEGQFFDGVPKTDEERVQSATGRGHLQNLLGRPYYITVKLDGASMTVAQHEGVTKVASRNYRLADVEGSSYWNAARNGNLIEWIDAHPHLAVQGELCGPGIQGNPLQLDKHECFVFDVYDRNEDFYWAYDVLKVNMKSIGAKVVPLHHMGKAYDLWPDDLLTIAEGKYDNTKNEREGLVIRNNDDGPRTSFKAISNRFLLKEKD